MTVWETPISRQPGPEPGGVGDAIDSGAEIDAGPR